MAEGLFEPIICEMSRHFFVESKRTAADYADGLVLLTDRLRLDEHELL